MKSEEVLEILTEVVSTCNAQVWTLSHEQLNKFAEAVYMRGRIEGAALEENPIAWMQRLQPEPPFETHNRITSVEEVARGWDNPIPLYARKGDSTHLWGIPDHERQAVCAAHYASEQQAIRARGESK
jgi:hypothetical protein